MKDRPIIFSTELIPKILDGSKTQTRRTNGLDDVNFVGLDGAGAQTNPNQYRFLGMHGEEAEFARTAIDTPAIEISVVYQCKCPYGQVGDRLWCTQGSSSSKSVPLEERFWGRIIKFSDHWEWMGRTNRKKYGIIRAYGKHWSTHRLMWKLQNGNIPEGLHILHRCDMPWCVNPDHLYLGTNEDNIADKMRQGRVSRQYGEANAQCKLSWEQIEEIKALYWEQHFYQADIAERFGISQSEVSRIVHNKRWREGITDISPTLGHRTLEIVSLRAERLQEVTEQDCIAEGIEEWQGMFKEYNKPNSNPGWTRDAILSYRTLWDSINGKRGHSWESNPWVWVIEFLNKVATIATGHNTTQKQEV